MKKRYILLFYILWALWACGKPHQEHNASSTNIPKSRQIQNYELTIHYAKRFQIEYFPDGKLLHLFRKNDTLTYCLVSKDKEKLSPNCKGFPLIKTPISRIIVLSATHVGLIAFLDAYDCLLGVSRSDHIYNTHIKALIRSGKIAEVGSEFHLDIEKIILLNPEIVMRIDYPGNSDAPFKLLEGAGISVLPNAEWLENTLLGRAEWIKVLAVLLEKDSLAQAKFNDIAVQYHQLINIVKDSIKGKYKPLLISGIPYKGMWGVPAGHSYMALAFKAAGGSYFMSNNTLTGSLQMDFEAVYHAGIEANIWLNPGLVSTKKELLKIDSRFSDLKPFKTNQIFNNTKRTEMRGENDYYELGLVRPDWHLADLIRIIHPSILPDHQLFFYKKLPD